MITNDDLKHAWNALDHLVGKLTMCEFSALRKCVEESQEAHDAAERIRPKVMAMIETLDGAHHQ